MTIATVFLLMVLYSVAGWIMEVVYVSLEERRLVDRGFLYGPLCPIYGVAGMFIGHFFKPLENNLLVLFLAIAVFTSGLGGIIRKNDSISTVGYAFRIPWCSAFWAWSPSRLSTPSFFPPYLT